MTALSTSDRSDADYFLNAENLNAIRPLYDSTFLQEAKKIKKLHPRDIAVSFGSNLAKYQKGAHVGWRFPLTVQKRCLE